MNLTKNFTLEELCKSETALRHGIANEPSPNGVASLRLLAEHVLQPAREHFGPCKVNSGYRSPKLNAATGGSATSDHCKGKAADIEFPGVPNATVAAWIAANVPHTQVILEFYTPGVPDSGWVHVSYDPANLKKQSLTAMRIDGKVVYKPGLIA